MTNMFASGNAAMIIDGPWDEGNWVKANINYGIAPLPTVSSTGLPMAPIIGAQGWFIASGKPPAETAAAFKFVAWFTNEQHQTDEFSLAGDLPSNALLANSTTITSSPAAVGYLAQAATSGPTPNFPAMGEAYTATGSYLTTIAPSSSSTTITTTAIQAGLNSIESEILKALGSL
jgi:arabinogalactan oligomer/maltooligosaccharide transport system substrate-binding protein